jgi:two-component system phosphate regulon response regulator PhoB
MPVPSAQEGRRLAAEMIPDLIVLDLDSGAEADAQWAVQLARSPSGRRARLAMLTADPAKHCGPQGERCGADLCVTKPVEPRELVRDLLRLMRPSRAQPQRPRARPPLKGDGIELDREQPTVRLRLAAGWRTVDLPWTEHRLLSFLLSGADKAHSREAIRDAVWHDAPVDLRTVDQYIRRLRRSLDAAGARELVKTLSGVGYRLDLAVLQRGAP